MKRITLSLAFLGIWTFSGSYLFAQSQGQEPLDLTQVKILYSAGQYIEVADSLAAHLRQNPGDNRARAVLILALIKLDERDLVRAQLNTLEASKADPQTAGYAKQLEALIVSNEEEKGKKQEIYNALSNYDAKKASDLVAEMPLSNIHKNIILSYIEVYQGDFVKAEQYLESVKPETLADKRTLKQITQQIEEEQIEFKRLRAEIDAYLYSEVTSNPCFSTYMTENPPVFGQTQPPPGGRINARDFQHYVENVAKFNALTPLNPQAMDLVFHVTMLGGDYASTELVGDRIIGGKGNIRIPFLSHDSYFAVDLDKRQRRISTEPDNDHKFQVLSDIGYMEFSPPKHSPHARWYSEEVPFNLSFDDLTGIEQKAGDKGGGLNSKSYALKVSPNGVAPNYLLMNVLECIFGEEAQRRATRNLALYVEHIIAPRKIQSNLVDPNKSTKDVWGPGGAFGSMITAMYGATATNPAMASMVTQMMTQQAISQQQANEAKRDLSTKWFAEMKAISDSFQDNESMVEVERLLQLQ